MADMKQGVCHVEGTTECTFMKQYVVESYLGIQNCKMLQEIDMIFIQPYQTPTSVYV